MNNLKKEYLDKLLGISSQLKKFSMTFEDDDLENIYRSHDMKNQLSKSKYFCLFLVSSYILAIVYSLVKNHQFIRYSYIMLGILLLEIILTVVASKNSSRYKCFIYIIYARFFLFYFVGFLSFHLEINSSSAELLDRLKFFRGFFNYLNFLFLYMIDFNYFMLITVPIANSLFIILLSLNGFFGDSGIYYDLIATFIYYFATFLIKKEDNYNKRLVFIDSFRKNNYIEYIINLIDGLKSMVITVKQNDIIFKNKYSGDYFEDKYHFKSVNHINEERNEHLNKLSLDEETLQNMRINTTVNLFFESLNLSVSPIPKFQTGTTFSTLIKEITDNPYFDSKNFYKIGYFSSTLFNSIQYFEVYIRNLKDKVMEILIYDITEVKQAEKTNIENKLKQKILSKIAHEFKTPILSIIALINKLIGINSDSNLFNNSSLLHVNNLSNYVLSLISDMIIYVSGNIDLRLNITQVYLKEVIVYCFDILNTLIECNENKQGKIKSFLEIDDNLANVILRTDEHRLKEIILNFISNAYKFTLSGFIKIKAKIKKDYNCIQIYIKDSGLGIKDEDKHLILQENFQFNLDQDYNSKGSDIGLSITKRLAISLNVYVGFKSIYGTGSKFFISFPLHDVVNIEKRIDLFCPSRLEKDDDRSEDVFLPRQKDKKLSLVEEQISTKRISYDLIKYDLNIENNSFDQPSYVNYLNNRIEKLISFTLGISNNYKDLIVVIDDYKVIRENTVNLIKTVLYNYNSDKYDIIEGSDGIDLLRLVMNDKEGKIKYIFCDENMEYLNGSETVKIIRNLENNKKVVKYNIISVTAFDDDDTRQRILNSGFNYIINKPCTKSIISEIMFGNYNI